MKDVFIHNFDKLLVSALFLIVLHWAIVLIFRKAAGEDIHQILGFAEALMGALLGLVTGVAIGQRMAAAPASINTETTGKEKSE